MRFGRSSSSADRRAATALRRYLPTQVDSQLQAVVNPLQGPRPGSLLGLAESRGPSPRLRLIAGEYYVAFVPGHGPRVILEGHPGLVPRLPAGPPALAAASAPRP